MISRPPAKRLYHLFWKVNPIVGIPGLLNRSFILWCGFLLDDCLNCLEHPVYLAVLAVFQERHSPSHAKGTEGLLSFGHFLIIGGTDCLHIQSPFLSRNWMLQSRLV